MAPERDDNSQSNCDHSSPEAIFEALWRIADSQVASMARHFDYAPWDQRFAEAQKRTAETHVDGEDSRSCSNEGRRHGGWWGGRHRHNHCLCHRHERGKQEQQPTAMERLPTAPSELVKTNQNEASTPFFRSFFLPFLPTFLDSFNDTSSASVFSVRYLVFSEYSPLYLDRALPRGAAWDKFGNGWMTEAYTDLLKEQQQGGKISDEEETTMALLDVSKRMQPTKPLSKTIAPSSSPKAHTELDLYERFLRDSTEHQNTKPEKQTQALSAFPEHDDENVVSTSKTVESRTSADGITHTKTIMKKVYGDGREVSNESVTTSRAPLQWGNGPVSSALRNAKHDSTLSNKTDNKHSSGGGWFWSK